MKVLALRRVAARLAIGVPVLLALWSCSATYKVTSVPPKEATELNPGVYYMLPKTQLLTVLSMTSTRQSLAMLSQRAWDICVQKCIANVQVDCKSAPRTPVETFDIAAARVYSRSRADAQQLYRVNVDFDTFAAFNHSFKISDQGVLTTANAELENKAVEIAINSTKAIAKLALGVVGPAAAPSGVDCDKFKPLYHAQQNLDRDIERVRREFDASLYAHPTLNAAAIEMLKARTEQKIDAIRRKAEYLQVQSVRKSSSETKVLGDYALMIEPGNATASTQRWSPIQSLDLEGYAGLQAVPADSDAMPKVLEQLAKISVVAPPDIAFPNGTVNGTEKQRQAAGFRYRVPATATVQVIQASDKAKEVFSATGMQPTHATGGAVGSAPKPATPAPDDGIVLASAAVLVAQYGALVSLPAEVKGLKSKIVLDLHESTGAPKQIDVGATPQASTLVGDVLSPLQEELDRRNKADADKKAAAEGAEIADLTKQRDVLQLRKEIQDLKDALAESEGAQE